MCPFTAAKSFGKFSDPFLIEIHGEILSHVNQEAMGHLLQPSHGIVVQDTDVLQPEPIRQGGLVRKDVVRPFRKHLGTYMLMRLKQHKFKQPAKPPEPPTPRTSILGLDRLAREKRAASASEDGDRKRQRQDSDKLFKGVGQETLIRFAFFSYIQPQFQSCLDPGLDTRGNVEKKRLHTLVGYPRPGGRNSNNTAETEIDREVNSNINTALTRLNLGYSDGINVVEERRDSGQKGLGEFQRRSNRDRGYDRRNWDETPRSERGGTVRVPNVGWESTPRNSRNDGGGWGRVGNRSWDAQTPRVARDTSPDGDDRAFGLDSREWEEEQVRLDRDWYTGAEEGGVAGDEEHNPLSQYEDLAATKEAEIASKQIVRLLLPCKLLVLKVFCRKRFLRDKHNM